MVLEHLLALDVARSHTVYMHSNMSMLYSKFKPLLKVPRYDPMRFVEEEEEEEEDEPPTAATPVVIG